MALCAENDVQADMVRRLREQVDGAEVRDFAARPIGALRNLAEVRDMNLAKEFQGFARDLPWVNSPRTLDDGEQVGLCDFGHMFRFRNIRLGLMYVDSGETYPEHNHEPHELYFLVSGTADWRYGGHEDYRTLPAGNVLYNHPWDIHGVRAGPTPSLSMYLLTPMPGEDRLAPVYPRPLRNDDTDR